MTSALPRGARRAVRAVIDYVCEHEHDDYCAGRNAGDLVPNDRRHVYATAIDAGRLLFPRDFPLTAEDHYELSFRSGTIDENNVLLRLDLPALLRRTPEIVAGAAVPTATGTYRAVPTRRPIDGGLSVRDFILAVSVARKATADDPPPDDRPGDKLRNWWLIGWPTAERRFQTVDPTTGRKVIIWLLPNP